MSASVLVTGGAGYVGSHTVVELQRAGYRVTVLDDLSTGHRAAVAADIEFLRVDLLDGPGVARALSGRSFDAILHFAARSLVGESMEQPWRYLGDNVTAAANLLRAAGEMGVRRFVLSSTANLFGIPEKVPIGENEALAPTSPYGESKLLIERMLAWADRLGQLKYATLRYFNAAGADASGRMGEDHRPETHLIPNVLAVALGKRDHVDIFGNDYPTPDGTAVRDYVHVTDLARAHLLALEKLDASSMALNLGSGSGYSVKQIVALAREVTAHPIPTHYAERRAGDPPSLIADNTRARDVLGWQPHRDLRTIVASAWRWMNQHPNGYDD